MKIHELLEIRQNGPSTNSQGTIIPYHNELANIAARDQPQKKKAKKVYKKKAPSIQIGSLLPITIENIEYAMDHPKDIHWKLDKAQSWFTSRIDKKIKYELHNDPKWREIVLQIWDEAVAMYDRLTSPPKPKDPTAQPKQRVPYEPGVVRYGNGVKLTRELLILIKQKAG